MSLESSTREFDGALYSSQVHHDFGWTEVGALQRLHLLQAREVGNGHTLDVL